MKGFLKIGIIAGLAYLVVWGIGAVKKTASLFTYEVAGYGIPTFSNWILKVPIVVRVHNPAPIAVTADRVIADLFIEKGGQWTQAAHVDQPVSVQPGDSVQTINAQGNLVGIFGGNFISTFQAFQSAMNSKLKLRTDVTVIVAGIALPTQSFTDTLTI